jgi:hypothetical protein
MVAEKYFQKYDVEGVTCILASQDIASGQKSQIVRVKGLTLDWVKKNKIKSGVTTLFASFAKIDNKLDTLTFPKGAKIKVCVLFNSSIQQITPFHSTFRLYDSLGVSDLLSNLVTS